MIGVMDVNKIFSYCLAIKTIPIPVNRVHNFPLTAALLVFIVPNVIEAYAAPDVKEHNVCTRCVFFLYLPPRVSVSGESNYGQWQSKVV